MAKDSEFVVRKTITEHYSKRKMMNPSYSMRSYARFLGISPSTLSGFVNRRRTISAKMARRILEKLKVPTSQRQDILQRWRKAEPFHLPSSLTRAEVRHFLSNWENFAILTLADKANIPDNSTHIAKILDSDRKLITRSLRILKKAGVLERKNGRLRSVGGPVNTGNQGRNADLLDGQIKLIRRVLKFLRSESPHDLNASCEISFSFCLADKEIAQKMKEKLKRTRRAVTKKAESQSSRDQRLYVVGVTFLPLTRTLIDDNQ